MEDTDILGDDLPLTPSKLFERLSQVPNYTWDRSVWLLVILQDRAKTNMALVRSLPFDL